MRSTAARLIVGVAACLAIGIAFFVIIQSERQLTNQRNALRTFDVLSREAVAALASTRTAESAYVAAGQGLGYWMSQVDALLESTTSRLNELRPLAAGDEARGALDAASAAVDDLRKADKRARQFLHTDQNAMASAAIFAEANLSALNAGRQLEWARLAEFVKWDSDEASVRRRQLSAGAGATGLGLLAIGFLLLAVPAAARPSEQADEAGARTDQADAFDSLRPVGAGSRTALESQTPAAAESPASSVVATAELSVPVAQPAPVAVPPPEAPDLPREIVPILKATVELCTDLNRARETDDLNRLLARAAHVMDASGLVVWIGDPSGKTLRPVLAHGYSAQALARMPHVPRSGDNAAAAAYRTGALQIVLTRPGVSSGALAAPMLAPDGCIGALTAEIRNGSETSDGVQALAAIVASQLAGVLAGSILQSDQDLPESRIASA